MPIMVTENEMAYLFDRMLLLVEAGEDVIITHRSGFRTLMHKVDGRETSCAKGSQGALFAPTTQPKP